MQFSFSVWCYLLGLLLKCSLVKEVGGCSYQRSICELENLAMCVLDAVYVDCDHSSLYFIFGFLCYVCKCGFTLLVGMWERQHV